MQVGRKEYDLLLFADINRSTCGQWFYFRVSKMLANIAYRFNIINCQKANSFFGDGMQPVVFSVKDATASLPHGLNGGWKRKGTNIAYYRNNYKGHGFAKMQGEESCRAHWAHFYTLTFTLKFDHDDDMVYVAYHYPYTYTTLQVPFVDDQNSFHSLHFVKITV
jgi:Cytosolic carboxypeptidase N-terminal domain